MGISCDVEEEEEEDDDAESFMFAIALCNGEYEGDDSGSSSLRAEPLVKRSTPSSLLKCEEEVDLAKACGDPSVGDCERVGA